ncbi:Zn-finger domain-containing protein (topoisomerase type I-like) [Idiomarina sp. A28L]|uniref:DNA topoisomerase family protein n=1 Tax=Idiomarina sp. A28L TaxID=1036674 RepID=UPI0002138C92|nr:type I DNA topoisomerase [Idiomarina sp. A28L]EGN76030.1 Zn-finger domain-containing protein (topoisomerase type I-like) [Idiomarina sp. A28L]
MTSSELFNSPERSDVRAEPCPRCNSAVKLKHIGTNSFWGCSSYPQCDYTQSLHEAGDFEPQSLPGEECPDCGAGLLLKKGRYGLFIGCSAFPTCHFMLDPTADKTPSNESITCPECKKGHLQTRTNRYGKQFHACDRYPKCKYALNEEPVAEACPDCGWSILVKRDSAAGVRLRCPQKQCEYKSEPI